jgi:hypothetical protein
MIYRSDGGTLAQDRPPASKTPNSSPCSLCIVRSIFPLDHPRWRQQSSSHKSPLLVVDELHHDSAVLQTRVCDGHIEHFDEVLAHADELEVRVLFSFEGSSF